jgi:hypothetical protein
VNCTGRIVGWSTFDREEGTFYRIWTEEGNGYLKFFLHWTEHPERDQAWYEKACESMTADQIARELDCIAKGSVADRVFVSFDEKTHVKEFNAVDILAWTKTHPVVGGQDVGYGDGTAYVLGVGYPRADGERMLYVYKDYYKTQKTPKEVAEQELQDIDLYKSPLGYVVWCDPSVTNKKQDGSQSLSADFAAAGLVLKNADRAEVLAGILAVETNFKGHRILIHTGCKTLITALYNGRWNKDRTKPMHDKYSHILDAFRYLVLMFFRTDPSEPVVRAEDPEEAEQEVTRIEKHYNDKRDKEVNEAFLAYEKAKGVTHGD